MEGRVILAHSLKVHCGREGRAAGTQGLWSNRIASASESKQGKQLTHGMMSLMLMVGLAFSPKLSGNHLRDNPTGVSPR